MSRASKIFTELELVPLCNLVSLGHENNLFIKIIGLTHLVSKGPVCRMKDCLFANAYYNHHNLALPSIKSTILCCYVTMVAENGQKGVKTCFTFVYIGSWNTTNQEDTLKVYREEGVQGAQC